MTERSTREQKEANPQRGGVDQARRNLTRLGVGGTPVLMTLASRPVLGANCLSNAISGNISDPDRGSCQLGYSVDTVGLMSSWGLVNPDEVILSDMPLRGLSAFSLSDQERTLRDLVVNGSHHQRVYLAAWVNAMIKADYIISEAQFHDLVSGALPVPGGQPLISYLESTLAP